VSSFKKPGDEMGSGTGEGVKGRGEREHKYREGVEGGSGGRETR